MGVALMTLAGCAQKEIEESKAIMPEETEYVLPAAASERTITIYADGSWVADVTEDWLSIDPTSGEGTVPVVLSAEANTSDVAREAKIIIRGAATLGEVEVTVRQKMDRFRDMDPVTVTEAVALSEGSLAKIGDCQVMALCKKGFVVSDGSANIYVNGTADVKAGDKLTVTGDIAKVNDIIGLTLDEAYVTGNEEVVLPEAKSEVANPSKVEFVEISASCASGKLSVDGKQVGIIFQPIQDISALNGREVVVRGYYVGVSSKLAALILVDFEDKGATPIVGKPLPFKDNFDWVAPLVEWDKANGRTQGNSMESNATVNYGNAYAIPDFEAAFTGTMGYESMFYSSKTVYVCEGNYLKFSKTNNCNGVRLPAFAVEGTEDVLLSFDWGRNGSDNVVLVVEIEGKGTIDGASKSGELSNPNEFEWQSESIKIKGIDAATRITIHPTTYTGAAHTDGTLYRWFLDNVEVVSLAGMVEADIQIEGLENNLITFEGTAPVPASFTVNSNADYSISTTASWLHLDVAEGMANTASIVNVTCDESDLSTLRKAEIVVKSGLSTKKIAVVQSAAGQTLDPLISVICSKPTDALLGEGDAFIASVQSNVEYKVEISDEWISEITAPETRGLIEKSEHSFTLAVNTTGASRTGIIRFYNEEANVEANVVVKQENFEPRIDVNYHHQIGYIPVAGLTFDVHISSNIDFTVTSDVVTLPVESAVAGDYDVKFTVPSNGGASRDVKVVFYSAKYDFTKTVSINQLGNDVLFADNFDWLEPLIANYNANAGKTIGDTMGEQNPGANAPNPYSDANLKNDFPAALAAAGYTDLNASAKVIYPQANYIKHSKTDNQTSLQFQPCTSLASASDISLDFDWFAHAKGGFEIDPVSLVVVIAGDGTFANGTKVSDVITNDQVNGEFHWNHSSVKISGATSETKLNIVPKVCVNEDGSYNWKVKGVYRWHLDNIVVKTR